ncbi:ABC transporter ATP-binding protein [Ktedonospora formicarum]|uniref:ABC transporter ATP-binding protein n=1 Tax=Ktedonospora formicarum TaxID=2778364 RepID=A0A8J3I5X7_9CHLR|nr:ABC transporter ATP-binding protein [Ktedonospora formicarum]
MVGSNGAGKTTLLHLACGLLRPSEGRIDVVGISPHDTATLLPRIGFVAQERSLYRQFTVNETLTLGKKLNPAWNETLARSLVDRLKMPCKRVIGKLSDGQQAQMAVIMALAKDPDLLILDEPFANVDPLAKHEISKILMEIAAERALTILISSHILADIEQLCDHLIILAASQVKLADSIEHIMEQHKLLVGPSESFDIITKSHTLIQASHIGRQSTVLLCTDKAVTHPAWEQQDLALETIVLAYLAAQEISLPSLEAHASSTPSAFQKEVCS